MKRIEDLVLRLRADLGIPDDERPDLLDLLRRLKFAGVISDYGPDVQGTLGDVVARWDSASRTITIAAHLWHQLEGESDPETRFTIFHEVGHAALGHVARNRRMQGKPQFGRNVEFDELEADDFALAFAIPLNFAGSTDLANTDQLATQFGLSRVHASRRLVALEKHVRGSKSPPSRTAQEPEDNYAEAMGEMQINAATWNS